MLKMTACCLLVIAYAISLSAVSTAQTCPLAAGCLDPAFGVNGVSTAYLPVSTSFGTGDGAVQRDGKILALSHVQPGSGITDAVVRFNADGSVDSSFGNSGVVSLNWTGANNTAGLAMAIALQPFGIEDRIVVAGSPNGYNTSLRVERYLSSGLLDTSFGQGGGVTISAGAAEAIAVQPDGKIVMAGTSGTVVRLNVNGSLDTTFGSGGIAQNNTRRIKAIALQSDGRIVAAGYWTNVQGTALMSAWRFNTNGSLDDGSRADATRSDVFGKAGKVTIDSFNTAWDVEVDSAGKILLAGSAGSGATDFAIARLTVNGLLDTTFGVGGRVTVDFSAFGDQSRAIETTSNGKILASGFTMTDAANRDLGLARLNPNGTLDASFGLGGKVIANQSSEGESFGEALIQTDAVCACEKLISVGTVISGGLYYVAAARFNL